MSFESLLTLGVTVRHMTGTTTSASGEVSRVYETTGTGAQCDIQAARVALKRRDLGEEVAGEYLGFFSIATDLRELDLVTDDAGVEYLVLFVDRPRMHHIEASLHRGIF